MTINNQVYGWGSSFDFTLNDQNVVSKSVPELIDFFHSGKIIHVAAGASGFSIILSDEGMLIVLLIILSGRMYAFGENSKGQLGISSTAKSSSANEVQLARVVHFAAGHYHTCAYSDMLIYCWGGKSYKIMTLCRQFVLATWPCCDYSQHLLHYTEIIKFGRQHVAIQECIRIIIGIDLFIGIDRTRNRLLVG